MHEETLCGCVITPIKTIGTREVYERKGYQELGVPKYVVFDVKSSKEVHQCRDKRDAIRWATKNQ